MKNRIRELRKTKGLSQQELADRMETSFQQVSRLEKSERQLNDKWLTLLSKALGQPKADFLVDDSVLPEHREFAQDLDEARLLQAWRGLAPPERKVFISFLNRGPGSAEGDDIVRARPRKRRG